VQVLDLERIVLAGRAVRAAPDVYHEAVTARLAELPQPDWQRIDVVVDELGEEIVSRGAAAEVLARFYENPHFTTSRAAAR
jgi:hypothetical protein